MIGRLRIITLGLLLLTNYILAVAIGHDRQYSFSELFRMHANELLTKGNEYLGAGDKPDSALICFSIVADRYSPSDSRADARISAMAYNNCGFIYYYFYNNFPEAFNSLLLAQKISGDIDDKALEANICLNLGNCYSMCFELGLSRNVADKSLEYYSKGYDLALEISNWPILLNCYANLALAPIMGECPDDIARRIKSFADVPLPQDIPMYDYYQLIYKTAVTLLDKDYGKSIEYLKEQLDIYKTMPTNSINRLELKAVMLYGLAYCLKKNGEPDQAIISANELVDFAYRIERPYYEALGYKLLIDAYSQTNDFAKERAAKLRFYEIKDAMMSSNNLMMVDNMEFIAKLRLDNQQYAYKEQQYRKRMMVFWGVLILLAVTLPLVWILYRQNRRLKASYLALYERQQRLLKQNDADRLAREGQSTPSESKSKAKFAVPADANDYKDRILNVLDHDQSIFDCDFSLDKLAELTDIKPRQLSAIINDAFDKNFYALLNEYRIREACRRLNDREHYGHLTIEAISQSVGYKSRTSLVSAFKKETGLTPSEYQKIAVSQAVK